MVRDGCLAQNSSLLNKESMCVHVHYKEGFSVCLCVYMITWLCNRINHSRNS